MSLLLCSCNLTKYSFENITSYKTEDVIGISYNISPYMSAEISINNFEPGLDMINITYKVVNDGEPSSVSDYHYRFVLYFGDENQEHFFIVNDRVYVSHFKEHKNKIFESTNKIDTSKITEILNSD